MPKIERLQSKIAEAQAYLAQLKARHQRIEQATRAEALARTRREETRRRIVCGAAVLQRVRAGQFPHETLLAWVRSFDAVRDTDLALFEAESLLPPTSPKTPPIDPVDTVGTMDT